MISSIKKILRIIFKSSNKNLSKYENKTSINIQQFSKSLDINYTLLKELAGLSSDINFRRFNIGQDINALLINISGISDNIVINKDILGTLMNESLLLEKSSLTIDFIKENILNVHIANQISTLKSVIEGVLNGNTALLVDGSDQALLIETNFYEHRSVEVPETEALVRGPRSGFTETLQVNTALVRQIIKTFDLIMECNPIGRRTQTKVCMVYIKPIANNAIIDNIRHKLNDIDIDAILESEYIEEIIDSEPNSIFPTVGITESPSRFASKILEGRVGILVDGTPFALTVPYLFNEVFQSMEDYYSRPIFATFMRILRYIAFHLTILLPAFYISLQAFHPALIPTKLLFTIVETQAGMPFPVVLEMLLMLLFFEGLREAGVRMPRPVGQAVSIVGALVLGEAAVLAGIVSPIIVIIVAITGIMSFIMPSQMDAASLLRFPILIMAGILGLVGVFWSYIFMIVHLASLSSFNVPYLSPLSPFVPKDMKDMFIRIRWNKMTTRPTSVSAKDEKRQSSKDVKS